MAKLISPSAISNFDFLWWLRPCLKLRNARFAFIFPLTP
jgi:hypothetical protein